MNFTMPLTPSPKIITLQHLIDVSNLLALCWPISATLPSQHLGSGLFATPLLSEMQTFFSG